MLDSDNCRRTRCLLTLLLPLGVMTSYIKFRIFACYILNCKVAIQDHNDIIAHQPYHALHQKSENQIGKHVQQPSTDVTPSWLDEVDAQLHTTSNYTLSRALDTDTTNVAPDKHISSALCPQNFISNIDSHAVIYDPLAAHEAYHDRHHVCLFQSSTNGHPKRIGKSAFKRSLAACIRCYKQSVQPITLG